MHTRRTLGRLALAAAAAAVLAPPALAQVGSDLSISPRRLVFNADSRAGVVYLFNQGATPVSYNVELVDRIMTPDGQIQAASEATGAAASVAQKLKSAKDFIQFTPRRVTLKPGESQTIRIRVQRPPDLPEGEYRTHLTVTAIPPDEEGLTAEQAAASKASGQLSVHLTALFSVTIPMIVRQGAPDLKAGLSDLSYGVEPAAAGQPAKAFLTMAIAREGNSSLFGDVEVRTSGKTGALVGVLRGVGVYPEIDRRAVRVGLDRPLAKGERLEISYKDADVKPGQLLAAETFTAP